MNRGILGCLMCLLCAGCGTFHLDNGRTPPPGRTADQQTLDVLVCKDEARIWSERAEAQARGFATGFFLPVIGIAVDASNIKNDQRAMYKTCMGGKGYTIRPATD